MRDHLTDDDLVLHFYGELPRADEARVTEHLAACDACRAADAKLRGVLRLTDAVPDVEVRPGFERDVWARLEPHLDAPRLGWRARFSAPRWAWAGGLAALVVAAFVAGRFSGPATSPARPDQPVPPALQAEVAPGRVLRAAVGDHLDRSQMVLVELLNSDATHPDRRAAEQARAADLVATSRLYRQSAEYAGDAATADILDDLERVLLEIANAPADATSKELTDLKARIAAQDLLFRVRVTASEMRQRREPDRETGDRLPRRAPVS